VHCVIDAVLTLLNLDLGHTTDTDHRHATGKLREPLLQFLAIIVGGCFLDLCLEEPASEQELLALLKSCPDEALKIWPVDKMAGNVRNNGPQLILPVVSNEVPA
jgi:hypothetical protein